MTYLLLLPRPARGFSLIRSGRHNPPMIGRAVAAPLILAPTNAPAHGGGLDDLGCHHNRRGGGYHWVDSRGFTPEKSEADPDEMVAPWEYRGPRRHQSHFFAARKSELAFLVTHSETAKRWSGWLEYVWFKNTGPHPLVLLRTRIRLHVVAAAPGVALRSGKGLGYLHEAGRTDHLQLVRGRACPPV